MRAHLGMAPVQGVAHSQDDIAGCHGPGVAFAGGGLPVMATIQQEYLGYVSLGDLLSNTLQCRNQPLAGQDIKLA